MIRKKAARRSPSKKRAPTFKKGALSASVRRSPAKSASQPAAAPVLSARQQREMRARAHPLLPLVHVGHGGISASVIEAVAQALRDHELIKVRLHEPEDKRGMAEQLAGGARAALCGLVGHTVILYRPNPRPARPSLDNPIERTGARPARAGARPARAGVRKKAGAPRKTARTFKRKRT